MLKYNNITPNKIYYRNVLIKAVKGCDGSNVWEYQEPAPTHDYSSDYLTIRALSANTNVIYSVDNTAITKTISASTDNGQTWTGYTPTTNGTVIATLGEGDKVLLKGENLYYGQKIGSSLYNHTIVASNHPVIEGNIMSLISGDSFTNATALSAPYAFYGLFTNSGYATAENLVLPATTLTDYCYQNMFKSSQITTPPALPATVLTNSCYYAMFDGSSITTAPVLSSTTLAQNCYGSMFRGCTGLTTAPELPATTLANGCYYSMFENCTALTAAPVLPAPTLVFTCYGVMFNGCTNLSSITCLATDISASNCTSNWVYGVSSVGTFTKASGMSAWTTGNKGIPEYWTVVDA